MSLHVFICLHELKENVNIHSLFYKKQTNKNPTTFLVTTVGSSEEEGADLAWEGWLS